MFDCRLLRQKYCSKLLAYRHTRLHHERLNVATRTRPAWTAGITWIGWVKCRLIDSWSNATIVAAYLESRTSTTETTVSAKPSNDSLVLDDALVAKPSIVLAFFPKPQSFGRYFEWKCFSNGRKPLRLASSTGPGQFGARIRRRWLGSCFDRRRHDSHSIHDEFRFHTRPVHWSLLSLQ